ncbi:electron transfer flavoprotein-ubiquinone oxidoreductase [Schizosaccharomyces cryophilus OY26]|uniref:Electron transfer flavoprotein-ubiquinone oxidoreductase n=1 Tax=Schizosaccharomyces cryophilus (strain OY26 / ATCC MYA-4695 / CBS 11777 / NBRC 106824 / NRRL Y48691) TaxID=653667 RepID=S9VYP3_SCHCR|nr:electron transfer flavoprotein-ubiquinone oxidoreductase [Schizosaccharomyces cryophilus OY26]EPY50940.1 electron transfer flavoprotein-ubiquinone oxidoreductase [Schizosaccharomyces cryophilus OY26]
MSNLVRTLAGPLKTPKYAFRKQSLKGCSLLVALPKVKTQYVPPMKRIQARNFCHSRIVQGNELLDNLKRIQSLEREVEEVDVCIVGAGPAGLGAAIRIKQQAAKSGREIRVIVLEKAAEPGNHSVSGAVIQPTALDELLPDWKNEPPRHCTPVSSDIMRFLVPGMQLPMPVPPIMKNHGNYIMSLAELTKWLAAKAEELDVELYPSFAASEVLYNQDGSVRGVATNDFGVDSKGLQKDNFERGMAFHAPITLFAEGARGSLSKTVIQRFNLQKDCEPQTYGLGIKEVWRVPDENFRYGETAHTLGWPLRSDTYGGGFMYQFGDNYVSVGLVVGLDYPNPYVSPVAEFQRMKQNPFYAKVLKGGTRLEYAARSLNEGGYQSIPKLVFPGGALIGCSAGFLNVPKIKGTHTAMKSGMVAADAIVEAFNTGDTGKPLTINTYEENLKNSFVFKELYSVRNVRPSFHAFPFLRNYGGMIYSALESYVLKGKVPWTFSHKKGDDVVTASASSYKPINYPKPDNVLSFDIPTSVALSGTMHAENQPCHLFDRRPNDRQEAYRKYKGVESRFCPAGVYEYVDDETLPTGKRFVINSQNCVHCKTCDIKDPLQGIDWKTPQGGDGPKQTLT